MTFWSYVVLRKISKGSQDLQSGTDGSESMGVGFTSVQCVEEEGFSENQKSGGKSRSATFLSQLFEFALKF